MQATNLLKLFPKISETLLKNKNKQEALDIVLRMLGEATFTDRVYYFKCHEVNNESCMSYTAEWCKEGISAQIDTPDLNNIPWTVFPDVYELLLKNNTLYGHINEWPESNFKEAMSAQDIQSFLFAKIHLNDKFMGFVGFDSCITKRDWTEEEATILSYLSDIIANRFLSDEASEKADFLLTKLEKTNVLLNKIRNIQSKFMENTKDYNELFNIMLDAILDYSGASIGFVGEVLHDEKGDPYLKSHAVTNIAWNKEMKDFYEANKANGLEFRNLKTLFGRTLEFDEIVISNSPISDTRRGGLPGGHPPLKNFLGCPVKYADKTIGMIGLANYKEDITQENLKDLDLVLDTYGSLIHILRLEKEKQASLELIEKQRKAFEELFETTLAGYWDWNPIDNTEYLSPQFKKTFGYEEEELENKPESWMALADPDDLNKMFAEYTKHENSGGAVPFKIELKFTHKDGSIKNILCGGKIFEWDVNGKPKRVVGCHIDLTALRKAEASLIEREEFLRQIAENVNLVFFVLSADRKKLLFVNNKLEQLYGINAELVSQDPSLFLNYIPAEDVITMIEDGGKYDIDNTGHFVSEHRLQNPLNHKIKHVRTQLLPVIYNGEIQRLVGFIEDITNVVLSEKKLKENLSKEKELNKLKSYFISMVSHQFRTPMAIIQSNIELIELKAKKHPEFQSSVMKHTERVETEIKWLTELLSDILLLEKSKSQKSQMVKKALDIKVFLLSIIADFDLTNSDLQIISKIEDNIEFISFVNESKLRHAIINILSNAYKYGGLKKGPEVILSKLDNKIVIRIKDSGIGIPDSEIKNLFTPFSRASNVGEIPGTGLGLCIAKEFIEQNNGTIKVTSEENKGTEIYIELPDMNS